MKRGLFGWILFTVLAGNLLPAFSAGDNLPEVKKDTIRAGEDAEVRSFSDRMEMTIEKIFRYVPLPAGGYSTETSWYFGLVKYNTFRVRSRILPDSLVESSKVMVAGTYSLNGQYTFSGDLDLVFGANRFTSQLKLQVKGFPSFFYGVGNDTRKEDGILTDFRNFEFTPVLNYDIRNRNFIGVKLTLNNYSRVEPLDSVPDEIPYRENEGLQSGLGVRYFFDSRDDRIRTERGLYLFTSFDLIGKYLGSDFDFHTFSLDLRGFITPWSGVTFAGQVLSRLQGGDVPVQSLAFVGGNYMLRGYYSRRFRDKSSVAAQMEVRFPIYWIVSGVVYGGLGQVAPACREMQWNAFHYAGGGGIRVIFDKRSRSAIRFDVSFSGEGHTFFLGFGEAF